MHGGPGPGSKEASEYHDKRPATKAAAALDFDFAVLRPYLISVFAALSIDEGWLSLHFEAARTKESGYRIKTPLGDAITCVLRESPSNVWIHQMEPFFSMDGLMEVQKHEELK